MAKYGTNPVDGRPLFRDTDSPDIKLDPQQVADYAAEVGNRIVGTTAYLENYAFKRDGLAGYDTTRGCAVTYRGDTWRRDVSARFFTTARGGMTDGTPFFQVPVEDTGQDTEPAFTYTYSNTDGRVTLEAGVYLLHAKGHPGSVNTGTSFLQLRGTSQGVLDRKGPAISADPVMYVSALFRADGSEGLIVEIQKQTGGSSNGAGTLSIARIGGI
jgi:hypothetical protein